MTTTGEDQPDEKKKNGKDSKYFTRGRTQQW